MSRESIKLQGTASERSNKNVGMISSENSSFVPLTPISMTREKINRINKNALAVKESRNDHPGYYSFISKGMSFGKTQPNLK